MLKRCLPLILVLAGCDFTGSDTLVEGPTNEAEAQSAEVTYLATGEYAPLFVTYTAESRRDSLREINHSRFEESITVEEGIGEVCLEVELYDPSPDTVKKHQIAQARIDVDGEAAAFDQGIGEATACTHPLN